MSLPDRIPPHSIEAEQATLGAMLISATAVETTLAMLTSGDFYHTAHGWMFQVIADLTAQGQPSDVLTVPEELRRRGQLDAVGGVVYVNAVADSVPTAAHVERYAGIVAEKALLRRLIEASGDTIAEAHDEESTAEEISARACGRFESAARPRQGAHSSANTGLVRAWERCAPDQDPWEHRQPMRLSAFDRVFYGIPRTEVAFVAGPSSTGKTALVLEILARTAAAGEPCALFSAEMGEEVVWDRLLIAQQRIDPDRHAQRLLNAEEWKLVGDWVHERRRWPLHVIEAQDLTLPQIVLEARRLHRQHGIKLFALDYIQLLSMGRKYERRDQELSDMAKLLATTAKKLRCPWLTVSSLSRGNQHRENKRPTLDDLRDSGGLGFSADWVWALWRESVGRRNDPVAAQEQARKDLLGVPDPTELLVLKNRNGKTGAVRLGYVARYTAYEDLDYRHDPADYGQAPDPLDYGDPRCGP